MVSPSGALLLQRGDDGRGVGGIGHEEHFVVGDVVGDQIVDDTAGFGAAQRVLRLAGTDPAEVVGECGVDVLGRARSAHRRLPEVADVEKADGGAGCRVLADGARVGNRHQPAGELGEAGAELTVPILERAMLDFTHADPP